MSGRRANDPQSREPRLTRLSSSWFLFAVLAPTIAAAFGLFLARGDSNLAFQPEIGVSLTLLVAVWQDRGPLISGITAVAIGVVGFVIPYFGWEVGVEISVFAVVAHVLMAFTAAAVYIPLSRRFSDSPVGPVFSLAAALMIASVAPALLMTGITLGESTLDLSYLQAAFLWGASAFLGGMLLAPVGLLFLSPYADAARGLGRTGEALLSTVAVALVAVVVAVSTFAWLLWALVPPMLWAAMRCGPRWVAGQIATACLVFVFFAGDSNRETGWVDVLNVQFALLTLVLSIPVVAFVASRMLREAQRAKIALELAKRDSLTGVYNRRALNDLVDRALEEAAANQTKVAIIYLDVDQFKLLNDTYGHAAGDEVLIEVGERLRASLRTTDSAVRVGGDEFVVVAGDLVDESALDAVVMSLRTSMGRVFEMSGRSLSVNVSMGAALGHGASRRDALLAEADRALYQDKAANDYKIAKDG